MVISDTFKVAVDQRKMARQFLSKCRNSGNNGRNCTIFGAHGDLRCPFDLSYVDLCMTSRDLSVILTFFKKILRKCMDVSIKTVGVRMV